MKIWVWSLFVMVVSGVLLWYVDLPLIVSIFIIVPVLIYLFISGSFLYSFRDSLKPAPIPAHGYEKRIRETDKSIEQLPRDSGKLTDFSLRPFRIPPQLPFCMKMSRYFFVSTISEKKWAVM